MSKAFTKEEQPDLPPIVPRRAPLPADSPNYVTPRGFELLQAELEALGAEQARFALGGSERAEALASLAQRKAELEERIGNAQVVDLSQHAPDEVRFGATVTVRDSEQRERRYQIVGVDEANAAEGRLAFVSPLATALLGRRVHDGLIVRTPRGDEELEVVAIRYLPGSPDDAA